MWRPGLVVYFFACIVAVTLVVAGVFGWVLIGQLQARERSAEDEFCRASAQAVANEVESVVESHLRAIETLAGAIESEGAQDAKELNTRRLRELLRQLHGRFGGFTMLYLGDSTGHALVAEPDQLNGQSAVGVDYSDRDYFKTIQTTGQGTVSRVQRGRVAVVPAVQVAAPVHGAHGEFVAYLSASIDLAIVQHLADRFSASSPGLEIVITDHLGHVIAHHDEALRSEIHDLSDVAFFRPSQTAGDSVRSGVDERGVPSRGAYVQTSSGNLNWSVIAYVPESLIDARVSQVSHLVALTGTGALLLALLLFIALASWLAQPIRNLADVALNASRGTFAAPQKPRAWESREVTVLLQAVDQMIASVREHTTELENRVAARTKELQLSNNELGKSLDALRGAQTRMALSDRMASIGTLAAGVAHEINNPLSYIRANMGFAADEMSRLEASKGSLGLAEAMASLREAQEGADRVRQIVADLKLFSRPDDESEKPTTIQLNSVLERSISMSAHEIRHRAELVRDFKATSPVLANESKLGQVFLNLLVNAAQAISEGEASRNQVRVRTADLDAETVVVEVSDTGSGISAEHMKRIFEPFFTTKPVGQGTGLGLAICHAILREMGGSIEVESEVGKGSTFRVKLPVSHSEAKTSATPAVQPAHHRGRVLVIDDDELVAKSVERILAQEHEVVVTTQARDGLARIERGEHYDLILCDVMMPEMSGPDFYAKLNVLNVPELKRVVFLTGGAFTATTTEFLAKVSVPVLEKPFESGQLRELVNEAVSNRTSGSTPTASK
jgi:C4-dicarboxylate-specific signal transduction histidine kinase/ActR/RegA family two-component response regulator